MSDKHIVRSEDVDWDEPPAGKAFGARRKKLGLTAGNERLGCSLRTLTRFLNLEAKMKYLEGEP